MEQTTWQQLASKSLPGHRAERSHHGGGPVNWHLLQRKVLHTFSVCLHWFEVGLAGISTVFVLLGTAYMIGEVTHFNSSITEVGLHTGFEDILSDILLLVVGVELAIMLVRRTPESLVEVMFFVIARKMLIKTGNIYELLIGVVALGGLFAIRKYLEHHPPERQRFFHIGKNHHHPLKEPKKVEED